MANVENTKCVCVFIFDMYIHMRTSKQLQYDFVYEWYCMVWYGMVPCSTYILCTHIYLLCIRQWTHANKNNKLHYSSKNIMILPWESKRFEQFKTANVQHSNEKLCLLFFGNQSALNFALANFLKALTFTVCEIYTL